MTHIALYFGSFNPIHFGHLIIAQDVINTGKFAELWLVISPHNPLKSEADLAPIEKRLAMCEAALIHFPQIKLCDIELHLPTPSYTIQTMEALTARHPDVQFTIIMGRDSVVQLHQWKRYEELLQYPIAYFERSGVDQAVPSHPNIYCISKRIIDISSTEIRALLKAGKSVQHLTPVAIEG
jgi:nicotinate-nucleotide adenylyltransferase